MMALENKALGELREARATLNDAVQQGRGSREKSLAITNLEQAILWLQQDLQVNSPPTNEAAG